MSEVPLQITPQEYQELLKSGKKITLLDVREPSEWQIANLGGVLIPLGELTRRYEELSPEEDIVVLCHHGMRSLQATGFLRSQGYTKARNLSGGIERWSTQIDPKIPRY